MTNPGIYTLVREALKLSRGDKFKMWAISAAGEPPTMPFIHPFLCPEGSKVDDTGALLVIQAGPNVGMSDAEWQETAGRYIDAAVQTCLATWKAQHLWVNLRNKDFTFGENRPSSYRGNAWKLVGTIRLTAKGVDEVGKVLQP